MNKVLISAIAAATIFLSTAAFAAETTSMPGVVTLDCRNQANISLWLVGVGGSFAKKDCVAFLKLVMLEDRGAIDAAQFAAAAIPLLPKKTQALLAGGAPGTSIVSSMSTRSKLYRRCSYDGKGTITIAYRSGADRYAADQACKRSLGF